MSMPLKSERLQILLAASAASKSLFDALPTSGLEDLEVLEDLESSAESFLQDLC